MRNRYIGIDSDHENAGGEGGHSLGPEGYATAMAPNGLEIAKHPVGEPWNCARIPVNAPGTNSLRPPGQPRLVSRQTQHPAGRVGRRPGTSRTSTGTTCGLPALCRRHRWAHLRWRSRKEHRDDVRASALPVGVRRRRPGLHRVVRRMSVTLYEAVLVVQMQPREGASLTSYLARLRGAMRAAVSTSSPRSSLKWSRSRS